jgi:hypothetical protein
MKPYEIDELAKIVKKINSIDDEIAEIEETMSILSSNAKGLDVLSEHNDIVHINTLYMEQGRALERLREQRRKLNRAREFLS